MKNYEDIIDIIKKKKIIIKKNIKKKKNLILYILLKIKSKMEEFIKI